DDDINAVPQEARDEFREAVRAAIASRATSDDEVAAFFVALFAHRLNEAVPHRNVWVDDPHRKKANAVHLPRVLRLRAGRRSEHGSQASEERAGVHYSST